jgi:hypothetical protein
MHVFMNNSYIKETLQYDICIGGIKENAQQLYNAKQSGCKVGQSFSKFVGG